mgnify:CR=1 FL=1
MSATHLPLTDEQAQQRDAFVERLVASTRGAFDIFGIYLGDCLGLYQALAGGLLARIRRELADLAGIEPAAVHAILTGGLSAAPWAAAIEGGDAIDPDLTLKGLGILHAEVTGGERLELGLP